MMHRLKVIGAAVCGCAGVAGCDKAPDVVLDLFPEFKQHMLKNVSCCCQKIKLDATQDMGMLVKFSDRLAKLVSQVVRSGDSFLVIGGDHSCAIGTWSGVEDAVGEFGLIWIDAHLDSHTPETSPSGNIHGMPAATLLGYGDKRLTQILAKHPKLKPENLVFMGIRSYESPEQALLKKLGVRIYYMDEILQRGFGRCFSEVIDYFKNRSLKFGITLDLDGLDPRDISSLGTPVEDGIRLQELLAAFESFIVHQDFLGIEFTEYNPDLDTDDYKDAIVLKKIFDVIFES